MDHEFQIRNRDYHPNPGVPRNSLTDLRDRLLSSGAFLVIAWGSVLFQRAILPGCALLIVLCFVTLTRADPDLWGHVRFGGDIIDSAAIRLPDTYSFTADKPWTNHEWLAEIIMAAAYRTAGAAGLVLLKLTIVALSLGCMWRIVRVDTTGIRTAAILMTLALAGILPRVQQVRPQLFSVLCFALLMTVLRRAEKRPAALWFAPPLFAVWANLHGGWLVGCGTLALWCSARTWTLRAEDQASVRSLAILWSACVAAVAATLINPYGPGLWRFLAETVGLSRRFISEWGPVTGSLTTLAVWSFFALLVVVAIKRAGRIPPLPAVIVPVFWGIVAFKVSRLDAFFALSTIALLAPELSRVFNRQRAEKPARSSPRMQAVMGVLAVVTLVVTVPQLKSNLLCIDVHASSTIPEPEAMEFVRNHRLAAGFGLHMAQASPCCIGFRVKPRTGECTRYGRNLDFCCPSDCSCGARLRRSQTGRRGHAQSPEARFVPAWPIPD